MTSTIQSQLNNNNPYNDSSPSTTATTTTAKTLTASPPTSHSQKSILILLLHDIFHSQKQTIHLFLSHGPTRTPTIVMYVASFGGALHAAVTTYYYLAIGASEMDIGTLGFIMSGGALLGAPFSGMALDHWGPWLPISITASACSMGCLWRGLASNLTSLRIGAILLGVGVNLWTVILGHLVKYFPTSKRSEILSGFGVQIAVLQLAGKGIFPLTEYGLHHVLGVEDALLRYRIHMGVCTFFCFYGTFALFWDKKNVVQCDDKRGGTSFPAVVKYQHKHSDSFDELEEGDSLAEKIVSDLHLNEMELVDVTKYGDSKQSSFSDDQSKTSTFLNEQNPSNNREQAKLIAAESKSAAQEQHYLFTTIILTAALLLQAIATTVFIVLWPLIVHDRFNLSAHTFGILTFISSVVSTGAVASFPIIERIDRIGGRLRCVAWGFGVCSLLSLFFCICSFDDFWRGDNNIGSGILNGEQITQHDPIEQLHFRKNLGLHAFSAVALQSALCFLEPSLKSNLSLILNSPTLGGTMGFLQSLGSIGGMVGNIAGTMMYKMSKDIAPNTRNRFLQGGSLPFFALSFFMAIFSAAIWMLEELVLQEGREKIINLEPTEDHKEVKSDCSCLGLRETTYDLKLD